MSKKALVLLGIIGLIIIFLMCAFLHWRSIEKDIANCSENILKNSQLNSLSVDTHDRGRNVFVSGIVTSEAAKQKALTLLADQCNMTGLDNDIKVVIPKPKVQAFVNLTSQAVTGNLASQDEINLFLSTVKGNVSNQLKHSKDVIPSNLNKYVGYVQPLLSNINDYNIDITPKSITLRGLVSSEMIKNKIGQYVTKHLAGKSKLNNLLTVVAPKPVVYEPLDAKSCQQELTELLSQSKIQFNSGSAVIKQESIPLLTNLAKVTKSCQNVGITLIGHTDNTGNAEKNITLSHDRAQSVVNYLLQTGGVQKEKLKATGVGSSRPIATNDTAEGRAKNRRIEFKVQSL